MNRRNVLKNLGLITGGVLLFPSCNFSDEKVSIILNKLQINPSQELLLKEIVDTILPEGEIPGGISLKAHNFVWVMVDDCTSKEKQNSFINGLNIFNDKVSETTGNKFVSLDAQKKLETLQEFMANKDLDTEVLYFLNSTKRLAIRGYMISEYIMTNEMPYKLVPGAGTYEGCKTIDNTKKININA